MSTTMNPGHQSRRPMATTRRRRATSGARRPQQRRPPRSRRYTRLRRALHFRLQVQWQEGLSVHLRIGPALLGVMIGIVVAVWWPELKPLLNLL
jgi:hypothetical protein